MPNCVQFVKLAIELIRKFYDFCGGRELFQLLFLATCSTKESSFDWFKLHSLLLATFLKS